MKKRKSLGTVFIEAVLIIVPYLALTLGLTEYLWYVQMKLCLTTAADAAVRVAAVDHGEVTPGTGTSGQSLAPYFPRADAAARNALLSMGYSDDFVSTVTVSIDYVQGFAGGQSRYEAGGVPQNKGRRLVGAEVSIPIEDAFIFGDFAASILQLATDRPEKLGVVAFTWKQWKHES